MRVEFTRPELAKYIYEMYGELDTIHGLCRAESKGKDMIRYTRSEEYIEFTVHKQGMKEIWSVRIDRIPKEFMKFFSKINDVLY
jgi:hypothetical protein